MRLQTTIGKKLFLSFGAALALTVAVGIGSLVNIGGLGASIQKLIHVSARKQVLAGGIKNAVTEATSTERGILVRAFMKDNATIQRYDGQFRETLGQFQMLIDELAPLLETEEGRRLARKLQVAEASLPQNHQELMGLLNSGQTDAAVKVFVEKVTPVAADVAGSADRLLQLQGDLLSKTASDTQSSVAQSRWVTMLMIGLSLLVAGVVVFIVRQINRSLRQVIQELSEGAEHTASAALQVSSSSQSLAQGSSEQAAALEETSASTEEISSSASKNTESARAAAELVTQSQRKFGQTKEALEQMVVAMGEISASSDRISRIIKVIDEIAFQTNILALNAAVEAARAGEAGMGFAVVADEVRSLAQRCAQAARDTAVLIEESIAKSNHGKVKVDEVAGAIRGITEESGKIKELVDDVNSGSHEQHRGIEQIGNAIRQMDQVTQKTAANAEESASAAEELNAQSQILKDVVGRLSAMVGGDAGHAALGRGRRTGALRTSAKAHPNGASTSGVWALGAALSLTRAPQPIRHSTSAEDVIPLEEDFKEF